jgi:hypothetical protein
MYRYETSTPRFAVGLAAVALSALTISTFVLVPAKVEDGSAEAAILAAAKPTVTVSEVVAVEVPADYVAIHEQALASAQCALPGPTTGRRLVRHDESVAESLAKPSCPPTFHWR